eukprot:5602975-Prymnesium_polylepis.1
MGPPHARLEAWPVEQLRAAEALARPEAHGFARLDCARVDEVGRHVAILLAGPLGQCHDSVVVSEYELVQGSEARVERQVVMAPRERLQVRARGRG